jgi:hypothetical protein
MQLMAWSRVIASASRIVTVGFNSYTNLARGLGFAVRCWSMNLRRWGFNWQNQAGHVKLLRAWVLALSTVGSWRVSCTLCPSSHATCMTENQYQDIIHVNMYSIPQASYFTLGL